MSMPSSRELVATTAGSSPALSSDSVRVRSARLIEPWCARARMVAACRVSMPTAVPDCAGTAAARSVAGSGTSSPRALGPDLVHPRGEAFRAAPGVGEHQRGPVLGDQVDDALLDVRPDRRPGQRSGGGAGQVEVVGRDVGAAQVRQVRHGHDDVDHDLLGRRRLDDRDGTPPVLLRPGAAQELGDRVDRPDRRGQPDPLCRTRARRGGRAARRAVRARRRGGRRAWCRPPRGSRRRSPSGRPPAPPGRRR